MSPITRGGVDFRDLQNEVIDHWENKGEVYFKHIDGETIIKPEYAEALDDPNKCLAELGYRSFSEYVRLHREFQNEDEVGVNLGYSLISKTRTKFFFQDIEFYIDRDPETSTATLWIRPGYDEHVDLLLKAIRRSVQ